MKIIKSLYIHIPFCRKKCPYCGFYSVGYNQELASAYLDVLCRQISEINGVFSTIYIGGGTPTILDWPLLEKMFKSLKKLATSVEEFTIEANPESLNSSKIKFFLNQGINRISIGVQSLNNDKLKHLGRIHSSSQAEKVLLLARKCGFKNISADLIFGVWEESLSDWKTELQKIVNLPVNHISTYALSCEKNTPFFTAFKDKCKKSDYDHEIAQMYKHTLEYLPSKKFKHYEVSNFANLGFRCRHNASYWQNNQYLGLGPSAVSFLNGVRSGNVADLKQYIKRGQNGQSLIMFQEKLSLIAKAKETAALKIRTTEGIDFKWFKQETGFDLTELRSQAIKRQLKQGLICYKTGKCGPVGICLTANGFLFADNVSADFV